MPRLPPLRSSRDVALWIDFGRQGRPDRRKDPDKLRDSWASDAVSLLCQACRPSYYVRRLGGIPRIFTEFVDGGSLADWIRSRRLYEGGPDRAMGRMKGEVTEVTPGDFPIRRGRRSSVAWINRQHARPDTSSALLQVPSLFNSVAPHLHRNLAPSAVTIFPHLGCWQYTFSSKLFHFVTKRLISGA